MAAQSSAEVISSTAIHPGPIARSRASMPWALGQPDSTST